MSSELSVVLRGFAKFCKCPCNIEDNISVEDSIRVLSLFLKSKRAMDSESVRDFINHIIAMLKEKNGVKPAINIMKLILNGPKKRRRK